MSLQGLKDGGLDLVLLLAEELLRGRVQQVGVLHDLHLYIYSDNISHMKNICMYIAKQANLVTRYEVCDIFKSALGWYAPRLYTCRIRG